MKAAVFTAPSHVVVQDVPEPEPNDANIILRVRRASICNGSDSAVFKGERDIIRAHPELKFPMIGGHECSGDIVHVGKWVEGFSVGDRIAFWCKAEGAFAEFNDLYPSRYAIVKLSDNVSYDEGSIMEMLGSTMQRGTLVELGETVVVFGLGPAGLLLLQEARLSGAAEVVGVDLHRNRLDKALELGADLVIDAGHENVVDVIRQKYGRMDVVMYAIGKNIFNLPLDVIRGGGKLLMYGCVDEGITFDANYTLYNAIDIRGFRGPTLDGIRDLMQRGERLVSKGTLQIKPLITHHIALEDIAEGIKMAAFRPWECIKIVVDIA
jgi:2-desacetyl-2-hydroxyethyl bacteriochlorophyllide A dehydrogenase